MISVAVMSPPHQPVSSNPTPTPPLRALPSLLSTSQAMGVASSVVTLPRLRVPSDSDNATEQHRAWPRSSHKDEVSYGLSSATRSPPLHIGATLPHQSMSVPRVEQQLRQNLASSVMKPLGFAATSSVSSQLYVNHSPSSPASFGQPDAKQFGLAHLIEAAEQCHDLHSATRKRQLSSPYQHSQQLDQFGMSKNRLHSIDYLISTPNDEDRQPKRARPELSLDMSASYQYMGSQPHQHSPQNMYQSPTYSTHTPVYEHTQSYLHMTPRDEVRNHHGGHVETKNVWETVLTTGNFPDDVCLSENPSCCNKATESASNPVKQGRWTNDEKEFAENLIQQVRNGEVILPPNVSLRKFIADSLQCKAMRVSKKFRSLRSCQSPQGSSEERKFNPLSLHSIMNEDGVESCMEEEPESPKRGSKTLKRSDYSQHGAVRSGRWSVEEENYAKAMIEAFKAGYLPLHGNVSLRKFLSEVLVCHPMRISKKFVGYVRKYHWYRIAAGKCDPEAKRQALQRLCQLEREFWASMQQNQEWAAIQQENRR